MAVLEGTESNDTITPSVNTAGGGFPGAGADVIFGIGGDDSLNGGGGADEIFGGAGADTVLGGAGNDSIVIANDQSVGATLTVDLGDGGPSVNVVVVGGQTLDSIDGGSGTDTVFGTGLADVLDYRSAPGRLQDVEVVQLRGGSDIFIAATTWTAALTLLGGESETTQFGSQSDTLVGAQGADSINGGADNDLLAGREGNDTIAGGDGNDTAIGGAGNDSLDGGAGDDSLSGGAGVDSVAGGAGNDLIQVGEDGVQGAVFANVDLGNVGPLQSFTVSGNGTGDVIDGGDGVDTVRGTGGADLFDYRLSPGALQNVEVVQLGGGDDILIAATTWNAPITLLGEIGNDTLVGALGDDSIDGGANTDLLAGREGNDTLVGGGGTDALFGGTGNDSLSGGAGFDSVAGGAGNDLIQAGEDGLLLNVAFANVDLGNGGPFQSFTVSGNGTGDVLDGGDGTDTVRGTAFADLFDYRPNAGALQNVEVVQLGGGNDIFIAATTWTTPITLLGEIGNDTLVGAQGGDSLDGGTGNDLLSGREGNDTIAGGDGGDTVLGGAGDDSLAGGAVFDSVAGGAGNDLIQAGEDGSFSGSIAAVDFGNGGPLLIFPVSGTATADAIDGGDGADTVRGTAAADLLDYRGFGGLLLNVEVVQLDNGNDIFISESTWTAPITLLGEAGNDTLVGAQGSDSLDGGADNDTLAGREGNDTVAGGDGADVVIGGAGDDSLSGGAGFDSVAGGMGNDVIQAGEDGRGSPTFTGVDLGNGGPLQDFAVTGNQTGDAIDGGDGADTVRGTVSGDLFDYRPNAVALQNVEAVQLGGGNDIFIAATTWTAPITLLGEAGDDTLVGAQGADSLEGGANNDLLAGREGNDTIAGGDGDDTALGGSGIDSLDGGAGNDSLSGGAGVDSVAGGAGNDLVQAGEDGLLLGVVIGNVDLGNGGPFQTFTVSGNGTGDVIDGGDGADTVRATTAADLFDYRQSPFGLQNVEVVQLGGGNDIFIAATTWTAPITLLGEIGNDTLVGAQGADSLDGAANNDLLAGREGNDTLVGGSGDDTLLGGVGADLLNGGDGADVFRYAFASHGGDTIIGFSAADAFQIGAAGFGGGLFAGIDIAATGRFVANKTGNATSPAGTGQFVFETDTDILRWDADGRGGATGVVIATLAGPNPTAADFIVVA